MTRTNGHEYPLSQRAITYFLMPAVSLSSSGLGGVLLKSDNVIAGILLMLFGMFFLLLTAFGSLMCSSIHVSADGIAARNFGRTLKFVRWEDVVKVKRVRRWNAGSRSFENVFYIFDGVFSAARERMVNLRGPIAFTEQIHGLRELLAKINDSARKYHFALVSLDQEEARKSAMRSGAGIWKRTVPEVNEVRIAEL